MVDGTLGQPPVRSQSFDRGDEQPRLAATKHRHGGERGRHRPQVRLQGGRPGVGLGLGDTDHRGTVLVKVGGQATGPAQTVQRRVRRSDGSAHRAGARDRYDLDAVELQHLPDQDPVDEGAGAEPHRGTVRRSAGADGLG